MPSLTRLARPSSTQALRQVGFIGNLPVDMDERIRAVVELRPQRLEEHHAYNIVRWAVRISIAAVAARFSGLAIGIGGIGTSQADALHVVERVKNFLGTGQVSVRWGALPAFANNVAGGVRALDNRWTPNPSVAELFNGIWQGGDLAAATGVQFDLVQTAAAGAQFPSADIGAVFDQAAPTGDLLLLFSDTANTSLTVNIYGYTVLPR